MEDNSIQMDEILKSLFHLSSKPIINLINGIFNTNYSSNANISYNSNEFVINSPGFKYATKRADCFLTLKESGLQKDFHLEFQLKNDKTMALRMYEYAFLKISEKAYSTKGTGKLIFPEQTVIFIEEDNNIEDHLSLTLEINGNNNEYNIPVYKMWNQDITSLISHKLYPLLALVPFSFRKEMDKISKKADKTQIEEKTVELMETHYEVAELLFSVYKDDEFTINDLEIVYTALNHITKHIFEKYGVADIINKEVEKMLDTLWNPELQRNSRLEAIRDVIIFNLKSEGFEFDEVLVRTKLNTIHDEPRLMRLQKLATRIDKIEKFLNRI